MAIRIVLDVRPALSRGTGVGTFVVELAAALARVGGDHRLVLLSSSWRERWRPPEALRDAEGVEVVDRRWPVRLLRWSWPRLGWPPMEWLTGAADVAHSPSPLLLPARRARRVVTVHDLYALRHPEQARGEMRTAYPRFAAAHARAADAVLTPSEAAAREARDLLGVDPDRLVVCGEDAAADFDRAPTGAELEASRAVVSGEFVLFVGTVEPRKNTAALLEAFAAVHRLRPDLELVLAGPRGWGTAEHDAALAALPCRGAVRQLDWVDRGLLRALYHRATLLVLPSRWEGFGLPLVEAMACGCPLVVSRHGALPEVGGEAALVWPDDDPAHLAELILRVASEPPLRARLVEAGWRRRGEFSWDRTAGVVHDLYRRLAGNGR